MDSSGVICVSSTLPRASGSFLFVEHQTRLPSEGALGGQVEPEGRPGSECSFWDQFSECTQSALGSLGGGDPPAGSPRGDPQRFWVDSGLILD